MSSVCTKGQYTTAWLVYNLIISGLAANNNYNGIASPHTLIPLYRVVHISALATLRGGLCLFVPQDNMQRYRSPISYQSVNDLETRMESDSKYFMGVVLLLLTMVLLLLSTSLLADSGTPCNMAAPEQHVIDMAAPDEGAL